MRTIAILTLLFPSTVFAAFVQDPVFTPSPVGAWSYSELIPAGIGDGNVTHFPNNASQFSGASFQGYVQDPFGKLGQGFDSYQIFTTFLLSDISQTIHVQFGGDDGKSLFLNDSFISGGGFSFVGISDFAVTAGVPIKVTLAGFNGPGGWVFGIAERDPTTGDVIGELSEIAGVRIDASGTFATPVPEPLTSVLFALGLGGIAILPRRNRRNNSNAFSSVDK